MPAVVRFAGYWIKSDTPASPVFERVKDGTSNTLIVFVHGLCGTPQTTFTGANGISWPEQMTNDNWAPPGESPLNSHSVYLLGYSSPDNEIRVPAISDKLLAMLAENNVARYDHIFFITHSLGGLIAMEMFPSMKERFPDIYSKVAGLIMIAAPAKGAPVANFIAPIISSVATYFGVNWRCSQAAPFLQTSDYYSYIDKLGREWVNFIDKRGIEKIPEISCAYETRAMFGIAIIVPEQYAYAHCDQFVPIEADHINIVKPENKLDDIYAWTRQRINAALLEVRPHDKKMLVDKLMSRFDWVQDIATNAMSESINDFEQAMAAQKQCPYGGALTEAGRKLVLEKFRPILSILTDSFRKSMEKTLDVNDVTEIIAHEQKFKDNDPINIREIGEIKRLSLQMANNEVEKYRAYLRSLPPEYQLSRTLAEGEFSRRLHAWERLMLELPFPEPGHGYMGMREVFQQFKNAFNVWVLGPSEQCPADDESCAQQVEMMNSCRKNPARCSTTADDFKAFIFFLDMFAGSKDIFVAKMLQRLSKDDILENEVFYRSKAGIGYVNAYSSGMIDATKAVLSTINVDELKRNLSDDLQNEFVCTQAGMEIPQLKFHKH
jgi:pimeloyl-ACP methyl ester carboxylesterase